MSNKINIGFQPITNRFLYKSTKIPKSYSMNLIWNEQLDCMCLEKPFPLKELKPQFNWITCFEPEDHLDELTLCISKLKNINKKSVIGAFSFKDDTTLTRLNQLGFKNTWRINPQQDFKIKDDTYSIETFQSKFNAKIINTVLSHHEKADVFIARHVIEHAYNIYTFVETSETLVKENGYLIFELPDCERAMKEGDCTILWEEHINYFTEISFKNFINKFNFEIIFWKSYKYPLENSITVILKKISPKQQCSKKKIITYSQSNIFEIFKKKMFERKFKLSKILLQFKKNVGPIAMLGAGHLSSTFLTVNEVEDLIEFIVDDNPHKNDMYMPNGKLKILNSNYLINSKIKLCLLGANPQNHENIIQKNKKFIKNGGIFKSIFPGTYNDIGEYL